VWRIEVIRVDPLVASFVDPSAPLRPGGRVGRQLARNNALGKVGAVALEAAKIIIPAPLVQGLRGPRLGRNRAVPLVGWIRFRQGGGFDALASASSTTLRSANSSSQSRFTDSSSDVIGKREM
jgi:hypothetical protein